MTAPRWIEGLREVAPDFDAFVVDQWGVLHDGQKPLPGAVEALERLRAAGRRIVLLSNSGRRRHRARAALVRMGFDLALFDGLVTSGELAWRALRAGSVPGLAQPGRRCLLVMRHGDRSVVEGLDLELVRRPEDADFLFISGVDSPEAKLEDYLPLLESCARHGLPALCSNPDRMAPTAVGLALAPGAVARKYEELGGRVVYFGKPDPRVFDACLELLGDPPRERVVVVGDSLEHDIRGARNAGLQSILIACGLHRPAFAGAATQRERELLLARLCESYGAAPDLVLPRFRW